MKEKNKNFKRLMAFAIAATMCLTALAIVPTTTAATTMFLSEDFSGGAIPATWIPEEAGEWYYQPNGLANITVYPSFSPCMELFWSDVSDDYSYIDTESVDTSTASDLTLRFSTYLSDYMGGYDCRVYVRADSMDTWTDVTPWSNPISGSIPCYRYTIDITSDIGSGTQVRFEFDGDHLDFNWWDIDDVQIYGETGGGGPTEVWVDDDWTCQADVDLFDPSLTWQYDAFASIQDGVDVVCDDGGIVNVANGTYGVTGQTNQGGFSTAILIKDKINLNVRALPGNDPVVKPVTSVEADIVSISIENSDNLIIDNIDSDQTIAQFDNWHVYTSDCLTVKNSMFEGGEDGIDFNTALTTALIENNTFRDITTGSGDEVLDFTDLPCTDVTIQDNLFDYNYRHITLDNGDSNFIIRRNVMDGTNSQEAIRLIDASNILIENNIIMNNEQQGIYIDSGCSDITVQHNTFFNNDQENGPNGEIRTKVLTADILIKNNIIYGNGLNPAFETTASSLPSEDYNLVYNTADGSFTFGTNTIVGQNPNFISTVPGSEDLHLNYNSPCIDTGTNLGVIEDIEGNPRDANPDMGAYEYIVVNDPPNAVYTWADADGTGAGTTIDFDASGSSDPSKKSSKAIITYEWDWTNDGSYDYTGGPTASHDYGDTLEHNCTLRVTDDGGLNDTFTDTVQAEALVEQLDINQSAFNRGFPIRHTSDGDWGGAQNFTPTLNVLTKVEIYLRMFGNPEFDLTVELRKDSPTGTLLDTVVFTTSEVPSSWDWLEVDFTDQNVGVGSDVFIVCPPAPSGVTTSFGYEWGYALGNQYDGGSFWFTRDGGALWRDLPSMYEFTFKTYGLGGSVDTPPNADYTWADADGTGPGMIIDFDASGSSDDNGITTYEWDWDNDGTYDYTGGPTASYNYTDTDPHDCTLRVTDTIGQNDTFTDTVQATVGGGPSTFFEEDFESGQPGWTRINTSTEVADGTPSNWILPPDYDTDSYYHNGIYGAYCHFGYNPDSQDEWLISPVIDLSTATDPYLSFWWETSYYWEADPYDNFDVTVQATTDGGTIWTEIWNTSSLDPYNSFEWYDTTDGTHLSLASYAGESNVQLAWRFLGGDSSDFALDDICVYQT